MFNVKKQNHTCFCLRFILQILLPFAVLKYHELGGNNLDPWRQGSIKMSDLLGFGSALLLRCSKVTRPRLESKRNLGTQHEDKSIIESLAR